MENKERVGASFLRRMTVNNIRFNKTHALLDYKFPADSTFPLIQSAAFMKAATSKLAEWRDTPEKVILVAWREQTRPKTGRLEGGSSGAGAL